ncbi:MAG: Na+:solute symporter [Calditrichaceae bacterium]|nr:Na+:solute symporter [Calditrichaceae bacterium]MBN2708932.1 Na+:solute symporter [Calditrichaceae bacterium]RQV97545.1 MAG: sodium:solute symporter [Calditrichota bacterium]
MEIHSIDLGIIILYILATIFIGFYISKRASKNLDSYFLGDKSMPWYVLGISNASGMFDITGTMWLVYLCFVYGMKSAWIPWVWPTFNQIFLMVYLSIWLRRSNVLTGAEWITFRFGDGKGGKLAHISVVLFALVSVIGFLAYAFEGIGKFTTTFLPWDLSANTYALIFMGITTIYVVSGGMFSVVFTEVLQFTIMTIASIAVGIIAMSKVSPEMLAKVIPEGWKNIFFGWELNLDWSRIMNSVNDKIFTDEYSLFTIFFMMVLFKGILVSVAGPAPNYDMQRILATRNPREAGLMSAFVNVALIFPRYFLITGLTVLALVFFSPQLNAMGADIDFEMVLPYAIKNFMPVGLMGILLAGLISAFMSTFAATVNAAPAYIVNDIYKKYINPGASNKKYVKMSYLASIAVVAIGIGFGFIVESINDITLWIVSSLWGGYAAANVLKWHWWRFNGFGYFWGMISGLAASLAIPKILPSYTALEGFPIILIISLIGCFLATLLTKPDDMDVLKAFYQRVRPWGFWKPVHDLLLVDNPEFKRNKNFRRDCFNVFIGLIWQISLVAIPMYLVIKEMYWFAGVLAIALITTYILKKNWYDKLEKEV